MDLSRRCFVQLIPFGAAALVVGCGNPSTPVTPPAPFLSPQARSDIEAVVSGIGQLLPLAGRFLSPETIAKVNSYYEQAKGLAGRLLEAASATSVSALVQQLASVVGEVLNLIPGVNPEIMAITTAIRVLLPVVLAVAGLRSSVRSEEDRGMTVPEARLILLRR